MELLPPSRATIVDACVEQLQRAVLSGQLSPGSRLPPERTLAGQLGVNRVTVRSALTRLAAAGLLEVRQGSGYTVRDFRRMGGPDLLPALAALAATGGRQATLASEVLRVRRHLTRALLERLAEVRPDPAPVVAAVAAFEQAVSAGVGAAALAEADAAVLAALLDASNSVALQLCFNPVVGAVVAIPALPAALFSAPASVLAGWRLVVAWLADPRPDAVGTLAGALAVGDAAAIRALGDWEVSSVNA